jgi:hypothetical protein
MNLLKTVLFVVVLGMMGATAGVLAHAKSNQRLGLPGVLTAPLPGSRNLEVLLPDNVPGYQSVALPQAAVVTNMLPRDTSFGQRGYTGEDGFRSLLNVVLMGTSRSSIHKPQVCLTGQGWTINDAASQVEQVRMDRPYPYDLPVMRLEAARAVQMEGRTVLEKGIYVYWFVDADRFTAEHAHRMLWMAHDMVFKNELDRWAYVAFFSVCAPGQEQATFDRMKKLIVATVPEFQLVPRPPPTLK